MENIKFVEGSVTRAIAALCHSDSTVVFYNRISERKTDKFPDDYEIDRHVKIIEPNKHTSLVFYKGVGYKITDTPSYITKSDTILRFDKLNRLCNHSYYYFSSNITQKNYPDLHYVVVFNKCKIYTGKQFNLVVFFTDDKQYTYIDYAKEIILISKFDDRTYLIKYRLKSNPCKSHYGHLTVKGEQISFSSNKLRFDIEHDKFEQFMAKTDYPNGYYINRSINEYVLNYYDIYLHIDGEKFIQLAKVPKNRAQCAIIATLMPMPYMTVCVIGDAKYVLYSHNNINEIYYIALAKTIIVEIGHSICAITGAIWAPVNTPHPMPARIFKWDFNCKEKLVCYYASKSHMHKIHTKWNVLEFSGRVFITRRPMDLNTVYEEIAPCEPKPDDIEPHVCVIKPQYAGELVPQVNVIKIETGREGKYYNLTVDVDSILSVSSFTVKYNDRIGTIHPHPFKGLTFCDNSPSREMERFYPIVVSLLNIEKLYDYADYYYNDDDKLYWSDDIADVYIDIPEYPTTVFGCTLYRASNDICFGLDGDGRCYICYIANTNSGKKTKPAL